MMAGMWCLVGRRPQFDGNYYSYWRFHICFYLRSLNDDVWSLYGWKCPMHNSKFGHVEPKLVANWNKEELHHSNLNCKGLHIIVSYVTSGNSSLLSNFTSSMEAWDFLERKYDWSYFHMDVSLPKNAKVGTSRCYFDGFSLFKILLPLIRVLVMIALLML